MDAQAQVLMCHGKVDLDTKGKSKSVDDDAQQQDIKVSFWNTNVIVHGFFLLPFGYKPLIV